MSETISAQEIKLIAVCSAGVNPDYTQPFWRALEENVEQFGMKLLFFNSFSSLEGTGKHDIGEGNIFHLINFQMIDGIIMLTETIGSRRVWEEIVQKAEIYQVPLVSVDHMIEGCLNASFRYGEAIQEIMAHLVEKHHYQRINFIASTRGNSVSESCLRAYVAALDRYQLPLEEERIGYSESKSSGAKQVVQYFIDSGLPFPEAIVCTDDNMALAVIKHLLLAGYHVPEDVAVTGFDGTRRALENSPGIFTVKRDYGQAARRIFGLLQEYFAGKKPDKLYWLDVELCPGSSCGCKSQRSHHYSELTRELYEQMEEYRSFNYRQIVMSAALTDNTSFQGVFDKIRQYAEAFSADKFWLCVSDDFLAQKEVLSDLIVEANRKRMGYSSKMDIILFGRDDRYRGVTDFNTSELLPDLYKILATDSNIMFFPLHALEQTIGYAALVYEPKNTEASYTGQFLMTVGNALENVRVRLGQQAIINNLEIKYIHDPMTGLFNRRGFYQKVQPVFSQSVEEGKLLLVMSVDLNGLKQINDTYGHADGDVAIITIGRAMCSVAPEGLNCARFGGDEFVAAGMIGSEEEAKKFQIDIDTYLEKFNSESGKAYLVTASIGYVTGVPNEQLTLEEFIKVADEKMYQAKVLYHAQDSFGR